MKHNNLKHLAIIMDGNRRWEGSGNQFAQLGHYAGLENISHIVEYCILKKITTLTLFAFSVENNNRDENEIKFLFELLDFAIEKYKNFLLENKVRIKFIGDLNIINNFTLKKLNDLESESKQNLQANLELVIAFNYSGRQDIIYATKHLLKLKTNLTEINESVFQKALYTSNISEPDFLIRTGGQMRLSNFLLWQLAYTELYFTQTNWPDFSSNELEIAINEFYKRKRNFGK